ncbi:hypothetical protein D1007_34863 [Hordeum vulgare]|nr:hypothetical protein D1007_34863 [Hordeum vulgare]
MGRECSGRPSCGVGDSGLGAGRRKRGGPRDAKVDLPFGPKLRASDDWKKAASGDSSNKEHYSGTSNKRESKNSTTSTKGGNAEVNSPVKNRTNYKRKDVPKHAYRRVAETKLLITDGSAAAAAEVGDHDMSRDENGVDHELEQEGERVPKKKKPTPANSAEAAAQPCQSQ